MNFGFTLFFRNPPPAKVSFAELYRKEIELAVAAEELGYDTGGTLSPVAWCASFLDSYGVNWVQNRQGSGIMAFIESWYANSMTNRADGSWTTWGLIMLQHYYTKV